MKNKGDLESCVYYFFNEVKEKQTKCKKIHKIIKLNFFIYNELTNQKKLLNFYDHFYLCVKSSYLSLINVEENLFELKKINTKNDDSILIEYDDIKLINYKSYLKNLNNSKKYLLTVINSYKHLLNSIQILSDHNIYHNNLNFDNIMMNLNDIPLISNFTFSIDYSRKDINEYIKNFLISYEPGYIEWPIELHILSFLLTNKLESLSKQNIEDIINEYVKNNNILINFGQQFVSSYVIESINYFNNYVNKDYNYILKDILQYSNTWDNFSLSILFLRIIIGIHKTIMLKNKFIINFMKLLVCNINLNPLKRSTIIESKNKFDIIIDSLSPKDFKDIIENF